MQARNIPSHVRHKQRMAKEEIMIVIIDTRWSIDSRLISCFKIIGILEGYILI